MAFSYRSALMKNVVESQTSEPAVPAIVVVSTTRYWDTEETPQPEYVEFNGEKYPNDMYEKYSQVATLRKDPIFQKKFKIFAENILCIANADVEKGLRLNHSYSVNFATDPFKGQKKKFAGLYMYYRQDGITYNISYEFDNIKDSRTGWFLQWFHDDECCGFSCDYYGCYANYRRPRRRND